MNDEIKKALEEINILSNTILNNTTYKPTINRREALYNYITNLQQENEKLSDKIEFYEDVDSDRCAYNEELQKENEHLKENNQDMQEEMTRVWAENSNLKTALDESQEVIADYKQENETLKEIINDNMTVYLEGLEDGKEKMKQCFESIYKSRCEKAIELIKNKLSFETYQYLKKLYDDIDSIEEIWENYEFEDLLNILQNGSDNE